MSDDRRSFTAKLPPNAAAGQPASVCAAAFYVASEWISDPVGWPRDTDDVEPVSGGGASLTSAVGSSRTSDHG